MKRAKKAVVTKEEVIRYICTVTCPHCKTTLVGGIDEDALRIKCSRCNNPIDLVHEGCGWCGRRDQLHVQN